MSKKDSFIKQATILAAAGLFVRFVGFLYRLPMTKLIGDDGNGIYAQGYNLYLFFLILSSAGLPAAISKLVSERIAHGYRSEAHKIFRVSLVVSGVMGLAASLALWFGARGLSVVVKSPLSYHSILTLAPTVFIVAIMSSFRGYFQGMKNAVPTAISQVIEQIINAIFSVALAGYFLDSTKRIELASAGGTAGTGIGALAGLIVIVAIYFSLRRNIHASVRLEKRPKRSTSFALATELLSVAAPIILGTAIFSVANLIDTMMALDRLQASKAFTQKECLQLYGQLSGKYITLTTLPVSISTALATAALPSIASAFVLRKNVSHKINSAMRVAMLLSIPAAVGIGVLGEQIILLLFPDHTKGAILLNVGSISIIFLALSQITTGMLQGIGRIRVPVFSALCGALVKIPLNYFLISVPSINILGAVISTIGCYAVASAVNLWALKASIKIKLDVMGIFVKPLIASALMGLCCFIVYYILFYVSGSNTISVLVAIIVGMLSYFGFLVFVKGINHDDLSSMPFGAKIIKVIGLIK